MKHNENPNVRHEIGERIYINCSRCAMQTEHEIIKSNYTDTQAARCTECQGWEEWII